MKKLMFIITGMLLVAVLVSGCGQQPVAGDIKKAEEKKFDTKKEIHVVSRENGSGTRGAFIELLKIEVSGEDGKKKDMTSKEAVIANKTDVMIANIVGDIYAIGYISLGSLNDSVKALDIDGVKASADNVKNKSYKISRPFNIATKGAPQGISKDFIDFIMSKEGQAIVANGYIAVNSNAAPYKNSNAKGKIVVAGSSSVTPVMEKLVEAYQKLNKDVVVEMQMSDSSAGMKGTLDGTCNIGMASRDLKDSEKEQLTSVVIALDGIAVIVNKENTLPNITAEGVRKVYTGESKTWNDIK